MIPLICPRCFIVTVVDAPALGEPRNCPCLDRPPYTNPVAMMRLRLPDGYELTRKVPTGDTNEIRV